MDNYNRQIIGYLIMAAIGAVIALGIYYIGKLSLDPVLVSTLLTILAALEAAAYKWIKHNFGIPENDPGPTDQPQEILTEPPKIEAEPPMIIPIKEEQ